MTPVAPNNTNQLFPLQQRKDKVITLRFNRNFLLTLLISILLHLSLLLIFAPKLFSPGVPQKDAPPLEITLGPPQKKETAPSELILPDLRPLPKALVEPNKTKPVNKIKSKSLPVGVVKKSETKVTKQKAVNKALPKPARQETSPDPLPGEDMQAYIKRQQVAILAKKGLSKQDVEEVMANNNPQSAGEKRDAIIRKNLDLDGTNGIFSIRYLGARTAKFSFKGWKNNINTARLEIVDVNATNGDDIKLAVIRKMIAIIRREYKGDFKWDSQRLRRVIDLSARVEDTDALEDFMMIEFFGPGSSYLLRAVPRGPGWPRRRSRDARPPGPSAGRSRGRTPGQRRSVRKGRGSKCRPRGRRSRA